MVYFDSAKARRPLVLYGNLPPRSILKRLFQNRTRLYGFKIRTFQLAQLMQMIIAVTIKKNKAELA